MAGARRARPGPRGAGAGLPLVQRGPGLARAGRSGCPPGTALSSLPAFSSGLRANARVTPLLLSSTTQQACQIRKRIAQKIVRQEASMATQIFDPVKYKAMTREQWQSAA